MEIKVEGLNAEQAKAFEVMKSRIVYLEALACVQATGLEKASQLIAECDGISPEAAVAFLPSIGEWIDFALTETNIRAHERRVGLLIAALKPFAALEVLSEQINSAEDNFGVLTSAMSVRGFLAGTMIEQARRALSETAPERLHEFGGTVFGACKMAGNCPRAARQDCEQLMAEALRRATRGAAAGIVTAGADLIQMFEHAFEQQAAPTAPAGAETLDDVPEKGEGDN